MNRLTLGLSALTLSVAAAGAAIAAGHPPWRSPPAAGSRPYRYEVVEAAGGQVVQGFRTDFDLVTDRHGAIEAVMRTAERSSDGKNRVSADISDSCKAAMHAPMGGVARVKLWPLSPEALSMGEAFLDQCAPDAVFLPLTDIVNVAIIPLSRQFKATELRRVGDQRSYAGFTADIQRSNREMRETTDGGQTSLISLKDGQAVIGWAPALSDLDLQEETPQGQPMTLKGTEHDAFLVTVDTATGAVVEAHTTYDDLDLAIQMGGAANPNIPRQKITRQVTLTAR